MSSQSRLARSMRLCLVLAYAALSSTIALGADDITDLKTRASSSDTTAQLRLAEIYGQGIGVPQNLPEAIKWCRMAAERGNATAQYSLGISYLHGMLEPKNVKEAIVWLKRAADQKHLGAIADLGRVYSNEPSVMDEAESMKWYRIGSNLDDIDCMKLLARKYADRQEHKESFLLIAKAASRGSTVSKTQLGQMYEKGVGVPVDLSKAAECYAGAALSGDAFAQAFLAKAYLYGDGVTQNTLQAAAWIEIAAKADYLPKRMLVLREYIKLAESQKKECRDWVKELEKMISPSPEVARFYRPIDN